MEEKQKKPRRDKQGEVSVKTARPEVTQQLDWYINDYLKPRTLPTTIKERCEKLGFDPLTQLILIQELAMKAFQEGRGYTDKGDAGAAYLGIAQKATEVILNKIAPNLQALKVDVTKSEELPKKSISAKAALAALSSDPFIDVKVSELPMGSGIDNDSQLDKKGKP